MSAVLRGFLLGIVVSMLSAGSRAEGLVPAMLPVAADVPPVSAMPIDGTWRASGIDRRVRIDRGRMYAVEGWTHLLVLTVEPGMVVVKDIRPTAAGEYHGDDLPLLGPAVFRMNRSGGLDVEVSGKLGPYAYTLTPVNLDRPDWYRQEGQTAGVYQRDYRFTPPPGAPPAAEDHGPALPGCALPVVFPDTGETGCLD